MSSLLIVGASGRAAAASAIRAGLSPTVIDLFADADTQRLCPVIRCPFEEYPQGFVSRAEQAPPGPWMYTGGLENPPAVVEAISRSRALWGNFHDVLATLRNPFQLSAWFARQGLPFPVVRPTNHQPPADRRWLRKPLRGSAGLGIRFSGENDTPSEEHFYQEFIPGEPMSALFCSGSLLGITRQLIGTDWLHAAPFRYAGNIGPSADESQTCSVIESVGQQLASDLRTRGIFGIDFIDDGGKVYVIEVNPRYTSSAELIDHAHSCSCLDWHRSAFLSEPHSFPRIERPQCVVGKGIYYSPGRIEFPDSPLWYDGPKMPANCAGLSRFADIPPAGTIIEAGQPVLSILVKHRQEAICMGMLKNVAKELDYVFGFERGIKP